MWLVLAAAVAVAAAAVAAARRWLDVSGFAPGPTAGGLLLPDQRLRLSGVTMAQDLRAGKYTSVELIELVIEQLERVDPLLNCLVGRRFAEARAEAAQADTRLGAERERRQAVGEAVAEQGVLPPFLGVRTRGRQPCPGALGARWRVLPARRCPPRRAR